MGKNIELSRIIVVVLITVLLLSFFSPLKVYADEYTGSRVIVSMGDSYSSGEGVPPFWDDYETFMKDKKDNRSVKEKISDPNWLAHRSIYAWSGQLILPDIGVVNLTKHDEEPSWYFVASSGATTTHIIEEGQYKPIKKGKYETTKEDGTAYKLAPQIDILQSLKSEGITPDYVTLTIGGNDAEFEKIIETAVISNTLHIPGIVELKLNSVWKKFEKKGDGIRENLKKVYNEISKESGKSTCILVGGYPMLFSPKDCGIGSISKDDAREINTSVHYFNEEIRALVQECQGSNKDKMNIEFVSVEEAFRDTDDKNDLTVNKHGAYSEEAYINPIMDPQPDDLKDINIISLDISSAFSIHPNILGIQAYRDCFQEVINRKEKEKNPDLPDDWVNEYIPTTTPTSMPTTPLEITQPSDESSVETAPAIDLNILKAAYREVLLEYEDDMRSVENGSVDHDGWGSVDSCALTDITGDDYPELVILYSSEGRYGSYNWFSADIRIFTILPGDSEATEMLHIPKATHFTTYGMACSDVILLSNGNLVVKTEDGDSFGIDYYTEYTLDGYSFQKVKDCKKYVDLEARIVECTCDGESISESEFNDQIDYYMGAFTNVLSMHPGYGDDRNNLREWEKVVFETPNNIMSFDEAWEILSSSEKQSSTKKINAAYAEVLSSEEDKIRDFESYGDGSVNSCALTDLTGDGLPELIILYRSDDVDEYPGAYLNAGISIYTVVLGETDATQMLRIPDAIYIDGRSIEIILLENGNLFIETSEHFHDEGGSESFDYVEYVADDYKLIPLTSLNHINQVTLQESYDGYKKTYDKNIDNVYTLDGISSNETDFNALLDEYKSKFVAVLAMSHKDYSHTDWLSYVNDLPNWSLSFDEAMELLKQI